MDSIAFYQIVYNVPNSYLPRPKKVETTKKPLKEIIVKKTYFEGRKKKSRRKKKKKRVKKKMEVCYL